MIACCSSSSPNIPRPASIVSEPNPKPQISVPGPNSEPSQAWKLKGSSHLQRWSRTRALRSGRKLDRPSRRTTQTLSPDLPSDFPESEFPLISDASSARTPAKSIYMVSDGTGWTAEHSVNAALGQFDHCLVDRACPVQTHLFSGIEDSERLVEIVKQAAKEGAMVAYTLAEPAMAESARQACELWGVAWTDILGPLTEAVAAHLGVSPSGLPRGRKAVPLSEEYFRRIEAVEFTIKHDDGALPQKLHEADVVLAGVSRTGKTPLSIYLAQKGLKVANVPIVMGVGVPHTLARVDPEKVFGLTINPVVLQAIRRARAKTLGLGDDVATTYSDMSYVRKEIEFARGVFAQNPVWPVIEVTGKAIEETAAIILRLYQDRQNRCSIPRISKRY